ncbi:hypothetical protein C8J56DRAFT_1132239 [Mycena floridula]|nr:hypothetical protein C8J56DRAFT_1132239 [Mycena floridula]
MNRDRHNRYPVDTGAGLVDEMQSIIDGTFEIDPNEAYHWNNAAVSRPAAEAMLASRQNVGYGRPTAPHFMQHHQVSHQPGHFGPHATSYSVVPPGHVQQTRRIVSYPAHSQAMVGNEQPPQVNSMLNDMVLQKLDQIITRQSTAEQEMEEFRQRVGQITLQSSSASDEAVAVDTRSFSGRGRVHQQKQPTRRRLPRNPTPADSEDGDVSEQSSTQLDWDIGAEDIGLSAGLSTDGEKVKALIQKESNLTFRRLTGVSVDQPWPTVLTQRINPVTNEVYLNVNFDKDVRANADFIKTVATSVLHDLKQPNYGDHLLQDRRFKWDLATVIEIVKDTFRTLKRTYRTQVDQAAADVHTRNQQNTRRTARRAEKFKLLKGAVDTYQSQFNVNPSLLLSADQMSDEASGPEDEESPGARDAWQREMARHAGIDVETTDKEVIQGLNFLEVIKPMWRSDELSTVLHQLRDFGLAKKNKKRKYMRIYDTDRATDTPPLTAPWNFGINPSWWKLYGPGGSRDYVFNDRIGDWNKYPDPPGFGSNKGTSLAPSTAESNEFLAVEQAGVVGEIVDEPLRIDGSGGVI